MENYTRCVSQRIWQVLRTSLFLFLILAIEVGLPFDSTAESIRIASSSWNILTIPAWLAKEKGFFQKYGLDVEIVYIPSGTLTVQALLGEDIKVALAAGSPIVHAGLRGAPVKIVYGLVNHYPSAFFSTPDIERPRDLRGKKVAVTRVGSSSYTATVLLLRKLGLEEGRDYAILQLGSTQNRLVALTKGMIQGTTLSAPESVLARNAGMKVLIPVSDMKKLGVTIQHQAVVTTEKSLRASRSVLKAFLKGLLEGIKEDYRNKGAAVHVLGKYTRISDPQVLSASYDDYYGVIEKEGAFVGEAVQVILNELGKTDPQAVKAQPGQFFDPSLVEELSREGFIKALWMESR